MNKKHLYILCALLVIAGTAITAYRWLVLEFPLSPRETTPTWRVETRIEFDARNAPAKLTLRIPKSEPGLTVLNESFVSPGFGLVTSTLGENRRAIFSKRSASGRQVIYYRALVHRSGTRIQKENAPEPALQRSGYRDAELAAAQQIVEAAQLESADLESFVRIMFARLNSASPSGPEQVLIRSKDRLAQVGVRLLAVAGVPARVVNGIALAPDRRDARPTRWIEIYEDGVWRPFDPSTNEFQTPSGHLPWWCCATWSESGRLVPSCPF